MIYGSVGDAVDAEEGAWDGVDGVREGADVVDGAEDVGGVGAGHELGLGGEQRLERLGRELGVGGR